MSLFSAGDRALRVSKTLVFRLTTVAVALAICLVAYVATRPNPADAVTASGISLAAQSAATCPTTGAAQGVGMQVAAHLSSTSYLALAPWYSIVPPLLAVTLARRVWRESQAEGGEGKARRVGPRPGQDPEQ